MDPAFLFVTAVTALIGTGALFLLIGLALGHMSRPRRKPESEQEAMDDAGQVLIL